MLRGVDDVRGTVIGEVQIPGALYYDGRRLGSTLWGSDDQALKKAAEARIAEIKSGAGETYSQIYPDKNKWELRIFD